jgi:hypothetical protein
VVDEWSKEDSRGWVWLGLRSLMESCPVPSVDCPVVHVTAWKESREQELDLNQLDIRRPPCDGGHNRESVK